MNVQDEWKVSQLLLIDNLFYLLLAFPAIFMTTFILFRSYFLPVSAAPLPSFHGDGAGADDFEDAVGAQEVGHGLDFIGAAGDGDGHGVGGDVDDFAAEDVDEVDEVGFTLVGGVDHDQAQFH